MPTEVVLLDFDGVLIDSDRFNVEGIRHACDRLSLEFQTDDFYCFFAGRPLNDGASAFLSHKRRPELFDDFVMAKKELDSDYLRFASPYPLLLRELDALTEQFSLGIVSGSRRVLIDLFLEEYCLVNFFRVIVSAENVETGKPSPAPYLKALADYPLTSPDNVIAIEDSPSGIQSARRAGIKCIAVQHTHSPMELSDANYILSHGTSLLSVILSGFTEDYA